MAVNINGYQLANSDGLTFGSSSTKLDASGRFINPNMPGFFGSKTSTATQNRQYPWLINSTTLNINTCWNTSTGVFTCPIAGLYYTSWNGICYGGSSTTATSTRSGYVGLIRNGVLYNFTHWNTNDVWDTQNIQAIISCASGDTLAWSVNIAPGPVGSTDAGAYGSNHNMSTIWFIG